jgi:tetratricopeptide (TPR) repeat protein
MMRLMMLLLVVGGRSLAARDGARIATGGAYHNSSWASSSTVRLVRRLHYNEAIRLDPNNAPTYNNRGRAYHTHGDLNKAISDYNEAIRLDSNDAPAYNNRGVARAPSAKLTVLAALQANPTLLTPALP